MKPKYKIKKYEKEYEKIIEPDKNICIRLDGHKFSKLTKKYFDKPFDKNFSNVMQKIAIKLMKKFDATFAYSQSDEITLIIPKQENLKGYVHPFNGRIQKLASLSASLATAMFNKSFIEIEEPIMFDSRVFAVPNEELIDVIIERKKDAIRNSKNQFARSYASHKELLNKNSDEQIKYVKEKYNKDWNNINDIFKFGFYVKKEKYLKNGVERSKYTVKPLNHNITYELIINKYINS